MTELYADKYILYRTNWGNKTITDFPTYIYMDLYDLCNQKCKMCHQAYRKRNGRKMPKELIDKLAEEFKQHSLASVNIGSSSESLMDKSLYKYAMQKFAGAGVMDTFTHTNAILLDDELIDFIISLPLKNICISLDAATAETYKNTRGTDSLDTIEKNIYKLIEARGNSNFPYIRVSFCKNPLNIHETDQFIQKWKSVEGIDAVETQHYIAVEGSVEITGEFEHVGGETCGVLNSCAVWPNGDVFACCVFQEKELVFGNLNEKSLRAIWNSEKVNAFRQSFVTGNIPAICKTCLSSRFTVVEN